MSTTRPDLRRRLRWWLRAAPTGRAAAAGHRPWVAGGCAVAFGTGLACWWWPVARLRAAALGQLEWPAVEALTTLLGSGVAAVLAAAWLRSGRAQVALAALLVVAVVAGRSALGALAPWHAAGGWGTALVAWLPAFAAAAFAGSTFAGSTAGGAGPRTAVLALLAAAVALLLAPAIAGAIGLLGLVSVGAVMLCAAAAMVPGALGGADGWPTASVGRANPGEPGSGPAPRGAAAAAPGLLLGTTATMLADGGWAVPGSDRTALLAAACALAAAPLWFAPRLPRPRAVAGAAAAAAFAATLAGPRITAAPWLLAALVLAVVGVVASSPSRSPRLLAVAVGSAAAAALLPPGGVPWATGVGLAAAVVAFAQRSATAMAWPAAAAALLAAVVAGWWAPSVPVPPGEVALSAGAVAEARYRERDQAMLCVVREREVDLAGPDQPHAPLLAGLLPVLVGRGSRVALCGTGTGRLRALLAGSGFEVTAVDPRGDDAELSRLLAADGPVAAPAGGPAPECAGTARAGTRRFLWTRAAGAFAAVVAVEPLLAGQPARASIAEHRAMRHAAGEGIVLQPFLLAATPPTLLAAALAAAAQVHRASFVLLAGDAGVIVGLPAPPDPGAWARRYLGLPMSSRWLLHEAGLGAGGDFAHALLGPVVADTAAAAAAATDEVLLATPHMPPVAAAACVEVVRKALGLGADAASGAAARLAIRCDDDLQRGAGMRRLEALSLLQPEQVLVRKELWQARVRVAEARIAAADPQDPAQEAAAVALAQRFLHVGCPSPSLQAALALRDRIGERVRPVPRAAALALALDPGFAAAAPPLLRPLFADLPSLPVWSPRVGRIVSPLSDLHRLPAAERLLEVAVGDGPLAVALRVRFPSACARALVEHCQQAPLSAAEAGALRELADPFVLAATAAALAARGAAQELLYCWRADLPATAAIAALLDQPPAARRALVAALSGHADRGSSELLARALDDGDTGVRIAAGIELARLLGERVPYDASWPQSRRRDAAQRLRALHNPGP